MFDVQLNELQPYLHCREEICRDCLHQSCPFQVSLWLFLVPVGLTKTLFSRSHNQTSHVSGERGEPWAACNDQHIPELSGIPAVRSAAVCADPQPKTPGDPLSEDEDQNSITVTKSSKTAWSYHSPEGISVKEPQMKLSSNLSITLEIIPETFKLGL